MDAAAEHPQPVLAPPPGEAPAPPLSMNGKHPHWLTPLLEKVVHGHPEYQRQQRSTQPPGHLADFVLATPNDPHTLNDIFRKLRWGGLFVFASPHRRQVAEVVRQFDGNGFIVEEGPEYLRRGWSIPFFAPRTHYVSMRKIELIQPGQTTERFTYQVQLARHNDPQQPYIVLKEVPTVDSVVSRLQQKFPEAGEDVLRRRAMKFTEKIFPTFLTREAGILYILREHLPAAYQRRVPHVIDIEKDERGFVRKLRMNWLRNGGDPLAHMDFAHQSADLLRVLHDVARVIHLDLRLDNFVITEDGVGFVDFGSAVREDEDLSKNPLLGSLFGELMRTSQIQQMLSRMTLSGHVTSQVIRDSHQKTDKAIDFFYLAVQFNCPHSNPDLRDLIEYDPESEPAKRLSRLTQEILRPADPAQPSFRSAKDILHGIERIQLGLDRYRY